jgi:hypothetical protein
VTADHHAELLRLIERVMRPPADSTQDEDDAIVMELRRRIPAAPIVDLIFYPERTEGRSLLRGRDELTPEEIVDLALSYKPIEL